MPRLQHLGARSLRRNPPPPPRSASSRLHSIAKSPASQAASVPFSLCGGFRSVEILAEKTSPTRPEASRKRRVRSIPGTRGASKTTEGATGIAGSGVNGGGRGRPVSGGPRELCPRLIRSHCGSFFLHRGGGRRAGARLVQRRGTPRRLRSLSQRMPSARTTAIIFRIAARYLALPTRAGTAGARTICHKERLSSDKYLRAPR